VPGKITTNIPQRLDRLPWSRFHLLLVIALAALLLALAAVMEVRFGVNAEQKSLESIASPLSSRGGG
jgi:hypothetical protein